MLPLVLVAAYAIWWLNAAAAFRDRTLEWMAAQERDGIHFSYADVRRAGFPLNLAVRFNGAAFSAPAERVDWTSQTAKVSVPLFAAKVLRVDLSGDQAGTLPLSDTPQRYQGQVQRAHYTLQPGGQLPVGTVGISHLSLTAADGEALALDRLEAVTSGEIGGGASVSPYTLNLSVGGLRFPSLSQLGGDGPIAGTARAELSGAVPPGPWRQAIADWRDQGGTVELREFTLQRSPIEANGDGTFALDGDGQPIAAMTIHMRGYDEALQQLAQAGVIATHTAAAARILLRALARQGENGVSELTAPLSLQDRTLTIGPVPLLKLSRWHLLDGGR